MSDLVYLYAVAPRPVAGQLAGIDGRPVRWIVDGDLAAAVSDVPAEEFEQEPLNARVRDLHWLGPRAVAHQTVNAQLHERAEALVPLAFGTVFRDDERVRDLLRREREGLRERLTAVSGRAEWVLALHRVGDPDVAALERHSPAVRELQAEIASSSPGRAHLLKRRLAELTGQELARLDAEAVDTILEALNGLADAVYVEPLPAEAAERPLLRASLLVARSGEAHFLETIERLRERWPERGYQLLLTGPWPAYRFGGLQPYERHAGAVA